MSVGQPGSVASGGSATTLPVGTAGAAVTSEVQLPAYEPPVGMLRRLTRAQFRNAVSDLTGFDVDIERLDADSYSGEFATIGASSVVTSELGVERYHAAVEEAVQAVFTDDNRRQELVGCAPSNVGDECVAAYIDRIGRRAWRRPLSTAEQSRLVGVAQTAQDELGGADEGLRWATIAILTSPSFLYRSEVGEPTADGTYRLTGYEVASRLAFLLTNTLPDDALLDEAESGVLATAEGRRAAAERLLATAAGRESVAAFADEYMRQDRVLTQAKDPGLFPEYVPALQAAMVRDMREVWTLIALDRGTSALEVFSTTTAVVNEDLARVYGVDATGLDATTFRVAELPEGSPRIGILGKLGFLSQFANQKEGSPTLRGKFIREAILCSPVPKPPGDIALEIPEATEDAPSTKRERLAAHRDAPACAACHAMMDPLGLPLETFDAIGRYRTTENDLPIDSSGEVDGTAIANARELGLVLSASETVAECLVRKYYSYAVGHEERPADARVIQSLASAFDASGRQLRSLMLDIVTSDAFVTVAPQL